MKEFDIFVPLFHNNGVAVEPKLFQILQKKLLEQFDGLTFFPQPNKGFWKMGQVTFQDEIVIYRVISDKPGKSRRFLSHLKSWMLKEFKQEEILIVGRKIDLIP